MLALAAALISVPPPQAQGHRPVGPSVQARATIRVIQGVEVRPGWPPAYGARLRDIFVWRGAAGFERAQLVEFE